jgi:alkanesulfonate monooxygenase SsuD/methylene tetrahydromethanopterin reductase-like flavin-dependent oxidoreductase (luciferase family)
MRLHVARADRAPRGPGRSDLDYWREHYLLGEADEVVERINHRIEAVGGRMDWVVLNPADWDLEELERMASAVLPYVRHAP